MQKISIIIAVYNGAKFIQQTIDSLLSQTYSDFEIIIIVNCSDDNTMDILKNVLDERITIYETNICQLAFNLNFGLLKSQGQYIVRIDADDIAEPTRLAKQLNVIETNEFDVVGSNLTYIDENNKVIGEKIYPEKDKDIRKSIFYKSNIAHPSVIYKKETILKVGGYMNGKVSEDYDLWLRLMRDQSVRFYNIQEKLTRYRIHSSQAKGNKYAFAEIAGYMLREAIYQKSINFFIGSLVYIMKAIFK